MYVKKFEGETLDETLKMVKRELGPDAIILKTVSNKGLGGSFRKKIQITAAISENNYTKKALVDKALDNDSRERFYDQPAGQINNLVNHYNDHLPGQRKEQEISNSYGKLGLNKVVNTVQNASKKIRSSYDDFMAQADDEQDSSSDEPLKTREEVTQPRRPLPAPSFDQNIAQDFVKEIPKLDQSISELQHKINLLEERLNIQGESEKEGKNPIVEELRESLNTLDLSPKIIARIIRKLSFECNPVDLQDEDIVFDFALRELHSMINTDGPMFSKVKDNDEPTVTILLGEGASGQGGLGLKMAALRDDMALIRYRANNGMKYEFTTQLLNLESFEFNEITAVMGQIRKCVERGQSVIVDIKVDEKLSYELKSLVDSFHRSYANLEVLLCLNATSAEIYNRKIISKYQEIADGITMNYLDQCLSYGSLINLYKFYEKLPLIFFGTGQNVPEDIEAASAERVLSLMFNL